MHSDGRSVATRASESMDESGDMNRKNKDTKKRRSAEAQSGEAEGGAEHTGTSSTVDETGDAVAQEHEAAPKPEEPTVMSLTEDVAAQKDKYIRLMAEFDNYKRRTGREYERVVESANERLMLNIIEVRENFERALKVGEENHDAASLLDGMKLIFAKLEENLKKNGLSVFAEAGEKFNPEMHDALMKTPHEDIPEDHIAEIYERGYRLRNHVIKHAKVVVSAGKPQQADAERDLVDAEEETEAVPE